MEEKVLLYEIPAVELYHRFVIKSYGWKYILKIKYIHMLLYIW